MPTTWGAEPYRNQMFDYDATVIQRLEKAGAILTAKLAMVELAGGMGYNNADASFTGPGLNALEQGLLERRLLLGSGLGRRRPGSCRSRSARRPSARS